jgi:hypothetical protein
MPPVRPDLAEIRRALALLYEPGDVVELRVPKAGREGTISGYFDDFDKLAQAILVLDGKGPGVYTTLNPVAPALLARAHNRVKSRAEQTTSDIDVRCRRWLLVDIDANRPAGISGTDSEREAALSHAREIGNALLEVGWPEPIYGDSGNCAHLLYRLPDLPNNSESTSLLKCCLNVLAQRFDDLAVSIDQRVFNASRVCKVYGTAARKGDSIPGRPHRLSRLLAVPNHVIPLSTELLAALAASRTVSASSEGPRDHGNTGFAIEEWLADSKLEVLRGPEAWSDGRRWILAVCPFNPEHQKPAILQLTNGALVYRCLHNSCAKNGWQALRDHLEPGWRDGGRENEGGRGGKKGVTQAQSLVALAAAAELFRTPDRTACATVPVGGHHETWPLRTKNFRHWLARLFYESTGKAAGGQALQDALNLLEARALYDGSEQPLFIRIAQMHETVYLDLADEHWRVVEISADGWRVLETSPVKFRRSRGMLPLPDPIPGGSIEELRPLLNLHGKRPGDWVLIKGWLIAALRPRGPFPVLFIHGEQGSAKSTMQRQLRMLIDPNSAPLRAEPRDGRDLVIAANNSWVLALDNLSYLQPWLSDAICRLATGGGFSTRELYTDAEEIIFDATRPVMLTGIEELATRSDLLDRSIMLYLPEILDSKRRSEKQLWQEFHDAQPRILGALLDAVSTAIRELPSVNLPKRPRMADFAEWAVAAESALCISKGAFLSAYCGNREAAHDLVLEGSSVADAVRKLGAQGDFEGTPTELLTELTKLVSEETRKHTEWPRNARVLSNKLRRLIPNLRAVGVIVQFTRGKARTVAIRAASRNKNGSDDGDVSQSPEEDTGGQSASGAAHPTPLAVCASQNFSTSSHRGGRASQDWPGKPFVINAASHADAGDAKFPNRSNGQRPDRITPCGGRGRPSRRGSRVYQVAENIGLE